MTRLGMFVLMVPMGLALAAMVPLVALAQAPRSPGQTRMAEGRLERLTEQLKLTVEQKEKVKPLLEDEMQRMRELRADSSLDRQGMMDGMKRIREESRERVRTVLTDEHKHKFDRMEQDQQNRMRERMRNRRDREI